MTEEKKVEFKDLNIEQLVINQDSDKLSGLLDEWDKKINEEDKLLQVVEENANSINKELVVLRNQVADKRQEQLDIESLLKKGNHNLRELRGQKNIIDRAFWRAKGK